MTVQPRMPLLSANLAEQMSASPAAPPPVNITVHAPPPVNITVHAPPGTTVTVVVQAPPAPPSEPG